MTTYFYRVFVPGSGAQTQHRTARRACLAFDRLTDAGDEWPVVHAHDGAAAYAEVTIGTVRDWARRELIREVAA